MRAPLLLLSCVAAGALALPAARQPERVLGVRHRDGARRDGGPQRRRQLRHVRRCELDLHAAPHQGTYTVKLTPAKGKSITRKLVIVKAAKKR